MGRSPNATCCGLALVAVALGLPGCVVPVEPIRYALSGPATSVELSATERPLQADDRLALVILNPRGDAAALQACVAAALASRLPAAQPAPRAPDAELFARIVALMTAPRAAPPPQQPGLPDRKPAPSHARDGVAPAERFALRTDQPPPEAATLGLDWLIVVEDATSERTGRTLGPVAEGNSSGDVLGLAEGRTVQRRIGLSGTIFDLRGRRRVGAVTTTFDTTSGSYVVAGIAATGGIAVPFVLPVIVLPAGTGPMTVCSAFGRAIGDALMRASTAPPP